MRADVVVAAQGNQVAAAIDHSDRRGAVLRMAGIQGLLDQAVGQRQRDVLLGDRRRRGGVGAQGRGKHCQGQQ